MLARSLIVMVLTALVPGLGPGATFAQEADSARIEELQGERDAIRGALEDGRDKIFLRLDFSAWGGIDIAVPASPEFVERAIAHYLVLANPQARPSAFVREMLEFDRSYRQQLQQRLTEIEQQLSVLTPPAQEPPTSLFGSGELPLGFPTFEEYLEQTQQSAPQPPPSAGPAGPLQATMVSYKCVGPRGTMSEGRVVSNYRCESLIDITNTGSRELVWVDRFVDATGVDGNVHQELMAYHRPSIFPNQTVRVNGYCRAPEPSYTGHWKAYGSARDDQSGEVFRWEVSGSCP